MNTMVHLGQQVEAWALHEDYQEAEELKLPVASGGVTNPPTAYTSNSEEYNGTSWSEGPNLNTARRDVAGSGANADAQRISGGVGPANFSTKSEAYNGTSWTEGPDLATGKQDSSPSMNASSNLTFMAGGYTSADTAPGGTEEFTQSLNVITAAAWASGGNLNTGRYSTGGGGSQTAAIAFGGYDSSASGKTEEYDGTSWTENNDMGTGRFYSSGSGIQTAALAVGGRTGPGPNFAKANVEEYDGSSWSEQNDIPSALNGMMGAGTQTAAVHFGGIASPGGSSSTGTLE